MVELRKATSSDSKKILILLQKFNNKRITNQIWLNLFNGPWIEDKNFVGYVLTDHEKVVGFYALIFSNFDINDKFADPQDIYEWSYSDLENFTSDFMLHYDVSMNVNKYIRAQLGIFDHSLINSIKKLLPVRSNISKIGVQLKPTYLERNKRRNHEYD